MKASQIRELSTEEQQQKYREWREEIFHLRFQAATGQLEKPHRIRQLRRDIARLHTIMKEKKK